MSARALCVGINLFKNYPQSTLHGCVNDANDMASVLKAYLGLKTRTSPSWRMPKPPSRTS